jgi:plasmid stabilization system protein ParE
MAEYRLSPAAEHDLENIWLYTCRQWSVGQAEHYIDMLSAAFGELASSPMITSACDHIRPGYRPLQQKWRWLHLPLSNLPLVKCGFLTSYANAVSSFLPRAFARLGCGMIWNHSRSVWRLWSEKC